MRVRVVALALGWLVALAGPAAATCNAIPGATSTFRAATGTVDRPFAGPGDVIALRRSALCDGSAGFGVPAADVVATFVFTPPRAPRRVVVAAADCAAFGERLARCTARADVADAVCVPARVSDDAQPATPVDLHLSADARGERLTVRLPDTDALVPPSGDGRTLTGPVTIAVSAAAEELPCALAATPCREVGGLLACVDALYRIDGTCGDDPHEMFQHFTALPPANEYQALCSDGAGCTGSAPELRFTVDADGNLLAPVRWSGVLVSDKLDLARLVRGSAAIPAFPNRDAPLRVPGRSFLHSYSPEGAPLPPIFEPQHDPTAAAGTTLFGSTDAERGVLRIDRRSATFHACAGGANDALPCNVDGECPDGACAPTACAGGSRAGEPCRRDGECPEGACGAALFDFSTRLAGGAGPVVIARRGAGLCERSAAGCATDADCDAGDACVAFSFRAESPVALDGLYETDTLRVSVVPEAFAGQDLNGDGDEIDDVLLLTDRISGAPLPIGTRPGAPGRAVTRVHTPPFSFPAIAADGDVVAFLEPEPFQGDTDLNGDGDTVDTILRVLQRTPDGVDELSAGPTLTADAAPVIDGESLAIAGGRVIFRSREAAAAPRRLRRVSIASDGSQGNGAADAPAISADGLQVAFESAATNLVADPAHGVFVHALDHGLTTAVPLLAPLDDRGWPGVRAREGSAARSPSLSGNGRFVALSAPDAEWSGKSQVWVTDRDADGDGLFDEPGAMTTSIVSGSVDGRQPGTDDSLFPVLTPDGYLMSFLTRARNLQVDGAGTLRNIWQYRDPVADALFKSHPVEQDNIFANTPSVRQPAPMSPLGSLAFASPANNLVGGDTNTACLNLDGSTQCADVFVYSPLRFPLPRSQENTEIFGLAGFERVSVGTDGAQANQQSLTPAVSWDDRFVAFHSVASNLVPGDTNGVADVFLRDRRTRSTVRLSLASDRSEADGSSFDNVLGMSADGRFVAFTSAAGNLAPDSTRCDADGDGHARESCTQTFLHDRITGFTERLSSAPDGRAGDGASRAPAASADGLTIAFRSEAANLIRGDTNTDCTRLGRPINCGDIFVSEPDPGALIADAGLDLSGDGDLDDTVVRAFDLATRTATTIGRAAAVSTAGDLVAFLSPECDGGPSACRAGEDLNGDADIDDLVAFLWRPGGSAQPLGRAGVEIATSERWLAVVADRPRTSPVPQDGPYTRLLVHRIGDGPDAWTAVDRDARDVRVAGGLVVFTEGEYLGNPLTGAHNFNARDRVLRLYDADEGSLRPVQLGSLGIAVEDFALGERLVAFSEREGSRHSGAADPACDRNCDGDCVDRVLQVYDVIDDRLVETGQAVTPCPVAACNPRHAFRVLADTVTFLTLEAQQRDDLNQDGDQTDLVLQSFNVRAAQSAPVPPCVPDAARRHRARTQRLADGGVAAASLTVVGAVTAGVCTTSGAACVSRAECGTGGECSLPPGGCIVDLGSRCTFAGGSASGCPPDAFCEPTSGGAGVCKLRQGGCTTDAECTAPARCSDGGTAIQRLVAPITQRTDGGAHLFVGVGRCVEDLATPCGGDRACGDGLTCESGNPAGARTCHRRQGSCRVNGDCSAGAVCRKEPIVAVAADMDGDEVADPYDNCPLVANVGQEDTAGMGVGDACRGSATAPSPTSFPTATRTPTASTTPTVAPTAINAPTQTPRKPPRNATEDDGCAIAPVGPHGPASPAAWMFLGLGALAVLARRAGSSAQR